MRKRELERPAHPGPGADVADMQIWVEQVKEHVKRVNTLEENLRTVYSLIYGQCTEGLRERIRAHNDFVTADTEQDALTLLRIIRSAMFHTQTQRNRQHAIHEAKRRFYLFSQDRNMSCQAYLEKFRNLIEVAEHAGATMGIDEAVARDILREENVFDIENPAPAEMASAIEQAKDRYYAVAFLLGSDRNRYGKLIEDLENAMVQGEDKYPKTLNDAYTLLLHWKLTRETWLGSSRRQDRAASHSDRTQPSWLT